MFSKLRGRPANAGKEAAEEVLVDAKAASNGTDEPVSDIGQHAADQQAALDSLKTKLRAATFAEIVSLLMRSAAHRERRIADLSWMVVPPFLANQFVIARARQKDSDRPSVAVGLLLWARVSDDLDSRFSQNLDKPFEINPGDWSSGDHLWVIDMIGNQDIATALIEQAKRTTFADRPFKMRITTKDGVRKILTQQGEAPRSAA